MGKKIKPNSLLDTSEVNPSEATYDEAPEATSNELLGNGKMTSENKEKLEKYDALEQSVAGLAKEKEQLENKVAEYAEKLAEAKKAAKEVEKLEKEVERLRKQLADSKSTASNGSGQLEKEIERLTNENDNYLVKISELTFENAKLTSQLQELTAKPNNYRPNVPSPQKDPYNPYVSNGYESWN